MSVLDDLSNGLDRIGKSIESIGGDAARATREFSKTQRLKGEIADEKRVINTQYLRLGKKYFEEHKDDPEGCQDPLICSILEAQAKIKEDEEQIEHLRDSQEAAKAAAQEEYEAQQAAKDAAAMDAEVLDFATGEPLKPADESDFVPDDAPESET